MQFTLAHQEGKLTAKVERNVKNLRGGCSEIFRLFTENRLYEIREVLDAVSEYPKSSIYRAS